jgi:DNA-binding transcriptional MocR family regulator
MAARQVGTAHLAQMVDGWRDGGHSSWSSLSNRLRLLIIDGRITSGTRLPAERQLASALGLSRTTVNAAYSALRADGFLLSRRGSGSVAWVPGQPGETIVPDPGTVIDLSRATSSAAPGVHAAARRALDRLPARLTTDGYELAGLPDLQQALADRYTARGWPTTANQIVVTSGSQSAISLIAKTVLSRGDKVLVESPSSPHALDAFRNSGARLIAASVDSESGWDIDEFERAITNFSPAIAYLMPDFHNPTALSMPQDLRTRLLRTLEGSPTILVVDEATAELNISRPWDAAPMGALSRRPEEILTVGSASKTIWGGLRVGWIRGEKHLIDRLVTARLANDLGASVLDQLTMTELLPDLAEIIEFRRRAHAESIQALKEGVAAHGVPWVIGEVEGGISAWVHLGRPVSSDLASASLRHGLLIGAGPWFGVDGAFERFIRIPITASPDAISRSLTILNAAWTTL